MFVNEIARKFPYIKMNNEIKNNIKKRLKVDLLDFDPLYVEKLCLHVEALFVFCILKSVVFSQFNDPNFQGLITSYRVEEEEPPHVPYYALRSYEMHGGEIDKMLSKENAFNIMKDYSLLGRECFIHVLFYLIRQNEDMVLTQNLFEHPVSPKMLDYLGRRTVSLPRSHRSWRTAPRIGSLASTCR